METEERRSLARGEVELRAKKHIADSSTTSSHERAITGDDTLEPPKVTESACKGAIK